MKMMSLQILSRNLRPQLTASTQRLHTSKSLFDSDSSESDSDDEKRKKKVTEVKQDQDKQKRVHHLNSLLQAMTKQAKAPSKVNVAVLPKKLKRVKPEIPIQDHNPRTKLFEDKLTGAAKDVAASLGGDTSKTESELLKKILSPATSNQEPIALSKLVMGMNIDRTKSTEDTSSSRADQVRSALQRTERTAPYPWRREQPGRQQHKAQVVPIAARVDLDSGIPINIFKQGSETLHDTPLLSTWNLLEAKELKLSVTHTPSNAIEQMIQWTEQGRLWRFPINNEQDMTIDEEEHFSDHIFLEQHLEDWCPTKGPIRHFMELVCVGLSKNPYVRAKDKKDHIMWFRDYFAKKHELLTELGAYGGETNNTNQNQIQA